MFYFDTASQISLLAGLCFPFCILVFSIWFKNAEPVSRLLGMAFLAPLLMNAASFMVSRFAAAQSLAAASGLLLMLLLSTVLVLRPSKKNFSEVQAALWSLPALSLLLINGSPALQNFLSQKLNSMAILVALALVSLYLLKGERGPGSILFWAVLLTAACGPAELLPQEGALRYAAPLIRLAAYTLFSLYFYRSYLGDMLAKMNEADRKLSAASRSANYEVRKRLLEVERVNEKLVNISKTDSLSKALNKAAILDFMEKLILAKSKDGFSVLMFDIDNFKSINDTLGHVAGDRCIKMLATLAKSSLREFDAIGRYGGDEFIIVLPDTTVGQAIMVAERFRRRVDATEAPHFTVSIGISSYPEDGATAKELVEAADNGLYRSKAAGKNTVSRGKS